MVKCVVKHCKNDAFIRFPHPASSVFHKWLEVLGDEELNKHDPSAVHKDKRICHTHFNRQSRRKLDKAVPTLHLTPEVVQRKQTELIQEKMPETPLRDVRLREESDEELPGERQKQSREQNIAIDNVCRTCLGENAEYNLFSSMYNGYSLIYLMEDYLNIKIKQCDGISSNICNNCMNKIQLFYNFTRQVQSSQSTIQSIREKMHLTDRNADIKNPPVIIEYVDKPLQTINNQNLYEDITDEDVNDKAKNAVDVVEENDQNHDSVVNDEREVEKTLDEDHDIEKELREITTKIDYDLEIKEHVLQSLHSSEQAQNDFISDDMHIGQEVEVIASTPLLEVPEEDISDCCESAEDCCDSPKDCSESPKEGTTKKRRRRKSKTKEWKLKVLSNLLEEERKLQLIENENIDIAQVYLEEILQKYKFIQEDVEANIRFYALQKNGNSNTGQLQEIFGVTKRKLAQEIDDDPTVIFSHGDICKITLYDPRIGKVYITIEQKITAADFVKKNYVDILTSVFKYDVPSCIRKSKPIKIYYKLKTDKTGFVVSDLLEMDENLGLSVLGKNNFPPSVDKRCYSKFQIYKYKIVNPFDEISYYLFQLTYNDYSDVLIPHLKEYHHKIIKHMFATEKIVNSYYFISNYNTKDFVENFQEEELIPVEKAAIKIELFKKPLLDLAEFDIYLRVAVYDISTELISRALIRFKEDLAVFNRKVSWHTRHWLDTKQILLKYFHNSDVSDKQIVETSKKRVQESASSGSSPGKCVILDHVILKPEHYESPTKINKSPKTESPLTGQILITNDDHLSSPPKNTAKIVLQKPKMVVLKTNDISRKLEIVSALPRETIVLTPIKKSEIAGIHLSLPKKSEPESQKIRKSDRKRVLNSKYVDLVRKVEKSKSKAEEENVERAKVDTPENTENLPPIPKENPTDASKLDEMADIDVATIRKENELLVEKLKKMSSVHRKEEARQLKMVHADGQDPAKTSVTKGEVTVRSGRKDAKNKPLVSKPQNVVQPIGGNLSRSKSSPNIHLTTSGGSISEPLSTVKNCRIQPAKSTRSKTQNVVQPDAQGAKYSKTRPIVQPDVVVVQPVKVKGSRRSSSHKEADVIETKENTVLGKELSTTHCTVHPGGQDVHLAKSTSLETQNIAQPDRQGIHAVTSTSSKTHAMVKPDLQDIHLAKRTSSKTQCIVQPTLTDIHPVKSKATLRRSSHKQADVIETKENTVLGSELSKTQSTIHPGGQDVHLAKSTSLETQNIAQPDGQGIHVVTNTSSKTHAMVKPDIQDIHLAKRTSSRTQCIAQPNLTDVHPVKVEVSKRRSSHKQADVIETKENTVLGKELSTTHCTVHPGGQDVHLAKSTSLETQNIAQPDRQGIHVVTSTSSKTHAMVKPDIQDIHLAKRTSSRTQCIAQPNLTDVHPVKVEVSKRRSSHKQADVIETKENTVLGKELSTTHCTVHPGGQDVHLAKSTSLETQNIAQPDGQGIHLATSTSSKTHAMVKPDLQDIHLTKRTSSKTQCIVQPTLTDIHPVKSKATLKRSSHKQADVIETKENTVLGTELSKTQSTIHPGGQDIHLAKSTSSETQNIAQSDGQGIHLATSTSSKTHAMVKPDIQDIHLAKRTSSRTQCIAQPNLTDVHPVKGEVSKRRSSHKQADIIETKENTVLGSELPKTQSTVHPGGQDIHLAKSTSSETQNIAQPDGQGIHVVTSTSSKTHAMVKPDIQDIHLAKRTSSRTQCIAQPNLTDVHPVKGEVSKRRSSHKQADIIETKENTVLGSELPKTQSTIHPGGQDIHLAKSTSSETQNIAQSDGQGIHLATSTSSKTHAMVKPDIQDIHLAKRTSSRTQCIAQPNLTDVHPVKGEVSKRRSSHKQADIIETKENTVLGSELPKTQSTIHPGGQDIHLAKSTSSETQNIAQSDGQGIHLATSTSSKTHAMVKPDIQDIHLAKRTSSRTQCIAQPNLTDVHPVKGEVSKRRSSHKQADIIETKENTVLGSELPKTQSTVHPGGQDIHLAKSTSSETQNIAQPDGQGIHVVTSTSSKTHAMVKPDIQDIHLAKRTSSRTQCIAQPNLTDVHPVKGEVSKRRSSHKQADIIETKENTVLGSELPKTQSTVHPGGQDIHLESTSSETHLATKTRSVVQPNVVDAHPVKIKSTKRRSTHKQADVLEKNPFCKDQTQKTKRCPTLALTRDIAKVPISKTQTIVQPEEQHLAKSSNFKTETHLGGVDVHPVKVKVARRGSSHKNSDVIETKEKTVVGSELSNTQSSSNLPMDRRVPTQDSKITKNLSNVKVVSQLEETPKDSLTQDEERNMQKEMNDKTRDAALALSELSQCRSIKRASVRLVKLDTMSAEADVPSVSKTISKELTEFLRFNDKEVEKAINNVPQVESDDVTTEVDDNEVFRGFSPLEQTGIPAILDAVLLQPKPCRKSAPKVVEPHRPNTRSSANKTKAEKGVDEQARRPEKKRKRGLSASGDESAKKQRLMDQNPKDQETRSDISNILADILQKFSDSVTEAKEKDADIEIVSPTTQVANTSTNQVISSLTTQATKEFDDDDSKIDGTEINKSFFLRLSPEFVKQDTVVTITELSKTETSENLEIPTTAEQIQPKEWFTQESKKTNSSIDSDQIKALSKSSEKNKTLKKRSLKKGILTASEQQEQHVTKSRSVKKHRSSAKSMPEIVTQNQEVIEHGRQVFTRQTNVQIDRQQEEQLTKGKRVKRTRNPAKAARDVVTQNQKEAKHGGQIFTIQSNVLVQIDGRQEEQLARGNSVKRNRRPAKAATDITMQNPKETDGGQILTTQSNVLIAGRQKSPAKTTPSSTKKPTILDYRDSVQSQKRQKNEDMIENKEMISPSNGQEVHRRPAQAATDITMQNPKETDGGQIFTTQSDVLIAGRQKSPAKTTPSSTKKPTILDYRDSVQSQKRQKNEDMIENKEMISPSNGQEVHRRPAQAATDITMQNPKETDGGQIFTTQSDVLIAGRQKSPAKTTPSSTKKPTILDYRDSVQSQKRQKNEDTIENKEMIAPSNGQEVQLAEMVETSKRTCISSNEQQDISLNPITHHLIVEIRKSDMKAVQEKLKSVDTLPQSYKCKRCLKTFKSAKYLLKHIRRKHVKVRICCLRCKKKFLSYQALVRHGFEEHHDKQSKSLNCRRCGRTLRSFTLAKEHLELMHSCVMKKFKCYDCPRRFRTSTELKIHLLGL